MSTIYSHDDKQTIVIPLPKEKLIALLNEIKIDKKPFNEYSTNEKKKIFIAAIEWWQTGRLALDELAEIAMQLHNFQGDDQKLEDALYKCSEWNFYVRRIHVIEKGGSFVWFMNDVMNYYKEVKDRETLITKNKKGEPKK